MTHASDEKIIDAEGHFHVEDDAVDLSDTIFEGWAALANDFLDFARQRMPGEVKVRMFNPNMERHGWESGHTVLQVVNDDMPFLVDSITMALAELGIGVHVLGHPVVRVSRDGARTCCFSPDGKTLFLNTSDRRMAAVSVTAEPLGVGAQRELFATTGLGWLDFDVLEDGRFLALVREVDGMTEPLTVIAGWRPPP